MKTVMRFAQFRVEVMKETGHALPSLYKETAAGGLAKHYRKKR